MAPSEPLPLYAFDQSVRNEGYPIIVGLDEAGRGPLAGPVVAAAVLLNHNTVLPGINDSKKLTARKRDSLYDLITGGSSVWAVGICSHEEIDRINILAASLLAMEKALAQIPMHWNIALIDGNQPLPRTPAPRQRTVVGGDARSASIAAASIVAKVTRDRIMDEYHTRFPQYGFDRHKGYPTALHRSMVVRHGMSEIHRRTFCSRITAQVALDL